MYCYLSPKIALGIPFKRPAELQKTLTSHSGYVPSRTKYSFYCYLKKVFKQYYKWRLSVNIMFQKNNNHSNIHSFLLQHTSDVVYICIILLVTNWRRQKWQILSNNYDFKLSIKQDLCQIYTVLCLYIMVWCKFDKFWSGSWKYFSNLHNFTLNFSFKFRIKCTNEWIRICSYANV